VNGLLVSRGVEVPAVVSREGRGRAGRGAGAAAPGEKTVPPEVRMRVSVDVSGCGAGVVGAGVVGVGNPNDVSTGLVLGSPGAPGVVVYGLAGGMHVAIGSVPARK
jgi:hypothetical protein